MDQLELNSKTTWKPDTYFKKTDIVKLYDALSEAEEIEAVMRRMIHYPPNHETTFANLIARVKQIFNVNKCPHANYKNECYKNFKAVLNEFQEVYDDSGKPVLFTLTRTPTPTLMPSLSPTPHRAPSPFRYYSYNPNPAVLPVGKDTYIDIDTYMYNIPDLTLQIFARMIVDCTTEAEKRTFIKKYMVINYDNDDSSIPLPHDIETMDNVIITILNKLRASNLYQTKIQTLWDYLKQLKKNTRDPAKIHILYPFIYPKIRLNRRNPTLRNLGGGRKRRQTKRRPKSKKCKPNHK